MRAKRAGTAVAREKRLIANMARRMEEGWGVSVEKGGVFKQRGEGKGTAEVRSARVCGGTLAELEQLA
eukprot:4291414-Pleurochrysis_carterae.AAC.1